MKERGNVKMAKAKWLEQSTNKDLIGLVITALNSGDEKEVKKAIKAAEELNERTPDTDGQISVGEALEALKEATAAVEAAYAAEAEAISEDVAEDVEDMEEEEDVEEETSDLESMSKKELIALAKELGIKNPKKKEKEELIELITEAQGEADDEDEEDVEDEDVVDYSEMSKKDLIALAKERGLKVNKKMKPADIIELLEADDEE